jgi:hypothetical protein
MRWLDVCGPPGSGKSTICDSFWGPHALEIEDRLPPQSWQPFLDEIDRLFTLIAPHSTFPAAVRMVNRSVRKVATVARSTAAGPYIQTCLAQRGLGFGWRMNDLGLPMAELERFFELMPVSVGVAVTRCPQDEVERRNHARKLVKETAHEDRAHMVALMQPAIEKAVEVLNARGVPILEVSTEQRIEDSRKEVGGFAMRPPFEPSASGRSCQMEVLSPPNFWLRPRFREGVPRHNSRPQRPPNAGGFSDGWLET